MLKPDVSPINILVLFLALSGTCPSFAANSSLDNKRIVERSFNNWRDGSGTPFDLMSPEASWTIMGTAKYAGVYSSKKEFIEQVIAPFNSRVQRPLRPTVSGLYADGNTVIATFRGETIDNNKAPYINDYVWVFEMNEGKIIKATAYLDAPAFDRLMLNVEPKAES
ncbi:hypothetical protein QFI66_001660 [Raoultella sp. BAC10a-01-01]|uniref:Ketosteroid isomerase n=1 Tax=Raoultella scottii TaxID=3040937 RepID=A0ABU8Z0S4_9ENTR